MVNNPAMGRCEFLGFYCQAGNAQTGCAQSLLNGGTNRYLHISLESYEPSSTSSVLRSVTNGTYTSASDTYLLSMPMQDVNGPLPATPATVNNCLVAGGTAT